MNCSDSRSSSLCSGVIAEKPDTALFALDLGGDVAIPKREKQTKRLRSDEILSARSAVPAVSSRKREGNPNVGDGIVAPKRHRSGYVSRSEIQKLKAIAHGQTAAPVVAKSSAAEFHDPWAEPVVTVEQLEEEKKSFIEKQMPVKPPKTLKQKPVVLAVAEKEVPAVKLPDAGISYNPEFAKWDQLLKAEGEKEVEMEKKRLAAEAEERRIQALREMSDEEPEEEEEEEDEESSEEDNSDESGDEASEVKAVKKELKRKTQAQKNKEKRRKEQERKREEEKKEKQMQRELMLIRKHERDVKAKEKMRMAKALAKRARAESADPDTLRKRRFGKIE